MSDAYDYNNYPPRVMGVNGQPPAAFIFHHTGGRGDVAGVQQTLKDRGLGVQYVMDRDGNITMTGGPGAQHMMKGWGAGDGLSNANTVGMEVIAKNNADVTPAQVQSAQRFITQNYPGTPVFGHGEVNPGHKEADEGQAIVSAIRNPDGSQPTQAAAQPPPAPNASAGAGGLMDLLAKLKGAGSGNGAAASAAGNLIAAGSTPTFANGAGSSPVAPGSDMSTVLGMIGKGGSGGGAGSDMSTLLGMIGKGGSGGGAGSAAGGLASLASGLLKAGSPQQAPAGPKLTPEMLAAMTAPGHPLPLNIPKLVG